jgi:hypothetical protein
MRRRRAKTTLGKGCCCCCCRRHRRCCCCLQTCPTQIRVRRFPRSPLPSRRVAGPLLNIHIITANLLSFRQHLGRIPWRRLQLRLPPHSTLSLGPVKPVGHISVIGKVIFVDFLCRAVLRKCNVIDQVLPMMGVSAREEAFMELIIRLIDLDIKPVASAAAPAAPLQQVCTIAIHLKPQTSII